MRKGKGLLKMKGVQTRRLNRKFESFLARQSQVKLTEDELWEQAHSPEGVIARYGSDVTDEDRGESFFAYCRKKRAPMKNLRDIRMMFTTRDLAAGSCGHSNLCARYMEENGAGQVGGDSSSSSFTLTDQKEVAAAVAGGGGGSSGLAAQDTEVVDLVGSSSDEGFPFTRVEQSCAAVGGDERGKDVDDCVWEGGDGGGFSPSLAGNGIVAAVGSGHEDMEMGGMFQIGGIFDDSDAPENAGLFLQDGSDTGEDDDLRLSKDRRIVVPDAAMDPPASSEVTRKRRRESSGNDADNEGCDDDGEGQEGQEGPAIASSDRHKHGKKPQKASCREGTRPKHRIKNGAAEGGNVQNAGQELDLCAYILPDGKVRVRLQTHPFFVASC
jgi:hypothetical protein